MNRTIASQLLRDTLNQHGLSEWKGSLSLLENNSWVGLCDYKKKTIFLNAFAVDIHPDDEIKDTVLHEVAHALVGENHKHDSIWAAKAEEIGARSTPCNMFSIPSHVVDAICSGHVVELIEETIKVPKYRVTRLQDECPFCHKVAKEKFSFDSVNKQGDQIRMITLECFHVITKIIPKATPFETMISNFWKPEIKSCNHEWNKHQCAKCHEYKLMNFQVTGARFAETALVMQKGVGIFDDMGLGKTVQGLAIPRFHKQYLPFLVVTKSAITYQWFAQIHRWLGPEYFSQIFRTGKDSILPTLKSYIIPYDLLRRLPAAKVEWLRDNIKLVILDECQQIKNPDSSRTQEVRKILKNPTTKVIELSGTPWKNRGGEFFPALNLLDPIKFYSYQNYLDNDVEWYYQGNKRKQGGIRDIPSFKKKTETLIIRREFNEVIEEFPEINRVKLQIQLDELTQSTYDESVSEFVEWYNDYVLSGEEESINGIEILAKMARMRHITGLAKIPATLGFVEEFTEDTDRKLVIFVHHLDVAKLLYHSLTVTNKEENEDWNDLAQELVDENIPVFMYHSGLNGLQRNELQNKFNSSKRAYMIASTLACGEGVDLQTCSDSILHERQWNPQNEDQATPGRFRRIGQTAKVITNTVPEAEGTIDEHLDHLVESKRARFHQAMNKGQMVNWSEGELGKELAEIIVRKHNEKFKGRTKNKVTNKAKLPPKQPTNVIMEW